MPRIIVKTKSKNYTVYIGKNYFNTFNEFISKPQSNVLFLVDQNVMNKCSGLIEKYIQIDLSSHHRMMIINSNESNKSLKTVDKILQYLVENKFDKNSILVSIGGGVLGDIAGLTASLYMRGITLIQIPTTILSAVDSSVGGKTGINFGGIKNLIGTFYQPSAVFINSEFFKTLPRLEIISGIGELVKYALLIPNQYDLFRDNIKKIYYDKNISEEIILTSLKFKSLIVNKDEKEETGLRKILNLGHTFAHGFESASDYKLKHGEAVFIGIISALLVAENFRLITKEKINQFLKDFSFIPIRKLVYELDGQKIINFMKSDKKYSGSSIKLVLPYEDKFLVDFPTKEKYILRAIEKLKGLIK